MGLGDLMAHTESSVAAVVKSQSTSHETQRGPVLFACLGLT